MRKCNVVQAFSYEGGKEKCKLGAVAGESRASTTGDIGYRVHACIGEKQEKSREQSSQIGDRKPLTLSIYLNKATILRPLSLPSHFLLSKL